MIVIHFLTHSFIHSKYLLNTYYGLYLAMHLDTIRRQTVIFPVLVIFPFSKRLGSGSQNSPRSSADIWANIWRKQGEGPRRYSEEWSGQKEQQEQKLWLQQCVQAGSTVDKAALITEGSRACREDSVSPRNKKGATKQHDLTHVLTGDKAELKSQL